MKVMHRFAYIACIILVSACRPGPEQGGVDIRNARSPATPPGASIAVVYMEMTAAQADKLLSAETPAADRVEFHSTMEQGGMMQMRPLTSIDLPADAPVRFQPGGTHLMLLGLHAPLVSDATFPITLRFENADAVTIEITVVHPGSVGD